MTKKELLATIEGGDSVTALFPAGIGIKNGRTVQEFKARTGKANRLLIFPGSHVVINLGGRHGTPGVVDETNLVSVRKARKAASADMKRSERPADELPERDFYEGESPDY